MQTMRLFIAIELNEKMKNALLGIETQLRENNVRGRYTNPDNLHLTLAFIGEYRDPDYVLETLGQVSFSPFELRLEGMGSFGRLWWCGLSGSEELRRCAAQIRHFLAEADIPFDRKKFSPHITLVREPDKSVIPEMTVPDAAMTVDGFSLMRSDRGKQGMIYTRLGTIKGKK